MNAFNIEVLPDGKIKVTSPGGFSQEIHADADEFLEMVKNLAGGDCQTKKLAPNLSSPHSHSHEHGHGHHHHHH